MTTSLSCITTRACLLSLAGLLVAVPVLAQRGQDAALIGTLRDASGAILADATVTVSSPQLIRSPQITTTDARGVYRFLSLVPGVYEVVAAAASLRTAIRTDVVLQTGATMTIDFDLEVSGVDDRVVIDAAAPVVDLRTSASPTLINRRLLENLPLPRTVYTAVNLAPGALNDIAYGGSLVANPLFIDGVSGNEPGWGTPAIAPALGWMEEVQIVAPGADAQYGEFTGALVHTRTRSGGNDFSGLADAWTTRPSWTGNNRSTLAQNLRAVEILERWDANLQVGGPAIKNKLWFFAAGEHYRDEQRPVSFSGISRTEGEPVTATTDRKYIVKLTSAVRSNMRAEGFFARTASQRTGLNASPLVSAEALGISNGTDAIWNGRFVWLLGARGVVDLHHGGTSTSLYVGPPEQLRNGPSPHFDQVTGVWSGNYSGYGVNRYKPVKTDVVLTYLAGAARRHEIRMGFEHEHATVFSQSGVPGGRLYLDSDGRADLVNITADATYRPSQDRWTWFGQDSWSMSERVTLNLGLRIGGYQGGVPTNEHAFSAATVSPRLGVAWVVTNRPDTVVRAHYGRYHDQIVSNYYDFLDPLSETPTIIGQVVGPDDYVEINRTFSGFNASIDRHLEFPFVEEILLGVERELVAGIAAKAQVIHRDFRDSIGFVDHGSIWQPVERRDPGPDGRAGTADDGGLVTVFGNSGARAPMLELTNPAGAYRRYTAAQFVVNRQHANALSFQASYTWSRTVGSYNNLFASNAAGSDLGPNGNFVDPNRRINTEGRTPQDFTHEVKALVTHRLSAWGGLNISGVYRYQSGRTWARSARFSPQTLSLVFVEPRATRQLPAVHTVDVRVEKTMRARPLSATIGLFVDVFNVANQGVALRVNNASGTNLGLPTQWLEPRLARAGIRLFF